WSVPGTPWHTAPGRVPGEVRRPTSWASLRCSGTEPSWPPCEDRSPCARSAIRRVFYRLLLLLNLEVLHRFGKLTDLLGKVTRGAQQLVPDLRAVGYINADRLATDLRAELFQVRNGDALHVLQDVASHQLQHDVLQQLVRRLVVLIKQSAVGLRLGLESLAEVRVVQTRDAHFSA